MMIFDITSLFIIFVAYLGLLFFIAFITDRGWIPERIARHPMVYTLSLGVYITAGGYYGSVGFADSHGYNFLAFFLGATLAFLLKPVLLEPILRLTREYQLSSIADLFAFRYRLRFTGSAVTVFLLMGTLPYIALQIRAVTESVRIMTQEIPSHMLALVFCSMLFLFAILFGARKVNAREKNKGLVVALAFESLVILIAISAVGLFAVFGIYGGPNKLDQWLSQHPEALQHLYQPVHEGPWLMLLLLSFAASFLLPRQFHMLFVENNNEKGLPIASWAFPLFLLLFCLAIPPILWSGNSSLIDWNPDYYVLGVAMLSNNTWLPTLAFIGGISAATTMIIAGTLALSTMCVNHLILPLRLSSWQKQSDDLYDKMLWARRALIGLIIFAGYGFYMLLQTEQELMQISIIPMVAVAQLLPGITGLLFWKRATSWGLMAGLFAGGSIWAVTLILPLIEENFGIHMGMDVQQMMDAPGQEEPWGFAAFWSLTLNGILFIFISMLTRSSHAEKEVALICNKDTLVPIQGMLTASSPAQFKERLTGALGKKIAETEVNQVLRDLKMTEDEGRPYKLLQMRERLEQNLSGIIGPLHARKILDDKLIIEVENKNIAFGDALQIIEERLEDPQNQLRGLAAELNALRRYHREVLQALPIGVCSIDTNGAVVTWNYTMEILSQIKHTDLIGSHITLIPEPWNELIGGFVFSQEINKYLQKVNMQGKTYLLNLHKASIQTACVHPAGLPRSTLKEGTVVVIEDITETIELESKLAHNERLAYIGALAAGVAHEIGNPLTGITCIAQQVGSEAKSGELKEKCKGILYQANRIDGIIRSLLNFSHYDSEQISEQSFFNLRECVDEAMCLLQLNPAYKRASCVNDCARDLLLHADRQRILQVITNLVTNAIDASRPGDEVIVRAANDDMGSIVIEVIDNGTGIPVSIKNRIFDLFFTTKEKGKGTGLGLQLVHNIVHDHGGIINLDSTPGWGTRVIIKLPNIVSEASRKKVVN